MEWEDEDIAAVSKKEYDCVICSQTTLNTPENPMGLVVLVQVSYTRSDGGLTYR